jgi:voltage-gated potassium channel
MRTFFRRTSVWVDIFVLLTLLFPQWLFNLGFLRVLRLWTLVNSEVFWDTIGRRYDDTRVEDIARAVATLLTFLFIVTGFVYTSFAGRGGIEGYVDALYFTITTLTTTGFGDITLPGTWGRLLSILIMVVGVTLFIRLAQAVFQPSKVRFSCPTCALSRHDPDAVHCKACGTPLAIPNTG